jgi:subtilisin family serine protease
MRLPSIKSLILLVVSGGGLCAYAALPTGGSASVPNPNVVEIDGHSAMANSILVKVKSDEISAQVVANEIEHAQLEVSKEFNLVPGLRVLTPNATVATGKFSKEQLVKRIKDLKSSGLFEYVEPDWEVRPQQIPSDSAYTSGELWGLNNIGNPGIDINPTNAWAVSTGSSVVVAVIDTGVRYTHQDLAANMWTNPNEIPDNNIDDDNNGYVDDVYGINSRSDASKPGDPMDDNDHGSHCAGTIAATANNGHKHVGVAYNARIMALKFLGSRFNGSGSTSDAIECVQYAVNHGADIMSNSWGGGGFSNALLNAIEAANDAGILFIAAAGNDSSNNDTRPSYPASYEAENVIAVASITKTGSMSGFSNYGERSVDIGAPGSQIMSCAATGDSAYITISGTSMACPHVAGVAALVLAQSPGATVAEQKSRLLDTAAPLPSLEGKTVTGGIVDAGEALSVVEDGILEIGVTLRGAVIPGNSVPVEIRVTDLEPVTNATVSARMGTSSAFTNFVDDATGVDLVAGDAIYSATLVVPNGVSPVNLNGTVTAPEKTDAVISVDFEVSNAPLNDYFNDRVELLSGTTQTTGYNINSTEETGEPRNPIRAGGMTVWWEWVAPSTAPATISTSGSDYDTTLAIYEGDTLGSLAVVAYNDDMGGGSQQSSVTFPAQEGVNYKIQVDGYQGATGNILLNYPSPGGDGLPVIISQPSGKTVLLGSSFSLSVNAFGDNLSYQWYLDDVLIPGATEETLIVNNAQNDDEGSYTVTVTNPIGSVTSTKAFINVDLVAVVPDNDDFINAEELIGAFGEVSGFNITGSGEGGEPNHGGVSNPLASVWWKWTASADGLLYLNTFGSDFDTVLAVYTGSAINSLSEVATNDDSGDTTQSSLAISVTAGVTYYIAVDGFDVGEGQISLEYNYVDSDSISNDDFAERTILPSASTDTFGLNVGATGEDDEPNHASNSDPLASVWWSWIAPADGQLTISTNGSTFDTTLGVYQGTSVGSLTPIASNDDVSLSNETSRVIFSVTKGQSFEIAVAGKLGEEGVIVLNLELSPDHAQSGRILLVEDQAGFGDTTQLLFDSGYNVTVAYDDATLGNVTLQDANFLSQFDFLVFGERGDNGVGSVMTSATQTALENYIQGGGHLLVTGYDTLGSPTDNNLADLVRATNPGDEGPQGSTWTVSIINHPILNGPNGDFRGTEFTATAYDNDRLEPDTSRGAVELVSLNGATGKLIFTELPGAAGSVGYWNGGLDGTTTDAQPDFNDGGNAQSIFLNYVAFALSGVVVEGPAIEVSINHASPASDGSSLVFGNYPAGQSTGNTLTIRNVGLSKLNDIAISVVGDDPEDISLEALPSTSLQPGDEFEISFLFSPSASGLRSSEIRIASSDASTPVFNLFIEGVGLTNTDGDLASDSWEYSNGFNPLLEGDIESLDTDGDGDLDIMEIYQGTQRNGAGDNHGLRNFAADAGNQNLSTTIRRSTTQTAVKAIHQWSCDLVNWYTSGQSDGTITVTITDTPTPVDGEDYEFVDVDIQITNGSSDCLFYRLLLIPNES